MIKFSQVYQKYGNFIALDNLNFDVEEGKLVALLGPNGAGKSTTMNIITGVRPPFSGDVYINQIDIFSDPQKAKNYIGYLPEIPPLYPELTVCEYLQFVSEIRNIDTIEIPKQIERTLNLLKISDRRNSLIRNLSKGLKQRVGIAQSIIHKPKILVMDEPTVGLEPAQLIEFRNIIRSLREELNMTVIISTHIMSEAAELCDKVIIINKGKKVFDGSKDKLLQDQKNLFRYSIKISNISDRQIDELKKNKFIREIIRNENLLDILLSEDVPESIIKQAVTLDIDIKYCIPEQNSLEKVFLELTL